MPAEQIRLDRDLLTRPDNTVSSMARLLGVSRGTICTYVPDAAASRFRFVPIGVGACIHGHATCGQQRGCRAGPAAQREARGEHSPPGSVVTAET